MHLAALRDNLHPHLTAITEYTCGQPEELLAVLVMDPTATVSENTGCSMSVHIKTLTPQKSHRQEVGH